MEYAQLTPGSGFSPAQSFMYYSQRLVTSPALRNMIVKILRTGVRLRHGAAGGDTSLPPWAVSALGDLRDHGCSSLGPLLSAQQIGHILAFLRSRPLKSRFGKFGPFTIDAVPEGVRVADYSAQDIVDAPHILALANRPALLGIASAYIGCKPTISALGLRWSFPANAEGKEVQAFHRDSDDWRYLKVFVYLTDVDENAGPHVFVKGTHVTKASMRLRFQGDAEVMRRHGAERLAVLTGRAGSAFVVDTAGIHKGAVPVAAPRLMLQIQYSLLPAFAYRYSPLPYRGALEIDPYVNRLICMAQRVQ